MRILLLLPALILGTLAASGQIKTPEAPDNPLLRSSRKHVQMMGMDASTPSARVIWRPTLQALSSRGRNSGQWSQLQPVVITIPVVFHVVYANETENISDAQLMEQLQVLNDDFRRTNADQDDVWPQAADTEIEFCLATRDPNGAPSNGILRVPTLIRQLWNSDNVKFTSAGGSDAWPTEDYMNFWVCNLGEVSSAMRNSQGGIQPQTALFAAISLWALTALAQAHTTWDGPPHTKWALAQPASHLGRRRLRCR